MSIELSDIKEKDVLLFNENFSFKTVSPLNKKIYLKSNFFVAKKDSLGIVIENHFGSIHEERYVSILYKNKLIYISLSSRLGRGYEINDSTFTKVI